MKNTKSPDRSPPSPNNPVLPVALQNPSELQSSLSVSINNDTYCISITTQKVVWSPSLAQ